MYFFCCSRLDYTTCCSCRFNYTEFPWAIQILWWCKWEAGPLIRILSAYTSAFWSTEFMYLSALFPSAAFGRGCHFPWKLSVKNKGQMLHFTPSATPTKGVQCPQNTEGSGAVFMSTHVLGVVSVADTAAWRRAPWLCCTAPGGFVSHSVWNSVVRV